MAPSFGAERRLSAGEVALRLFAPPPETGRKAAQPKARAFAVEVMGGAADPFNLADWLETLDSKQIAPYALQIRLVDRHVTFVPIGGEWGCMEPTLSTYVGPVSRALASLPRDLFSRRGPRSRRRPHGARASGGG